MWQGIHGCSPIEAGILLVYRSETAMGAPPRQRSSTRSGAAVQLRVVFERTVVRYLYDSKGVSKFELVRVGNVRGLRA